MNKKVTLTKLSKFSTLSFSKYVPDLKQYEKKTLSIDSIPQVGVFVQISRVITKLAHWYTHINEGAEKCE